MLIGLGRCRILRPLAAVLLTQTSPQSSAEQGGERRCQEVVINAGSWVLKTLLLSMMWWRAIKCSPELVKDGGTSGRFELQEVPNAEPGMSPVEIWCNEAQERMFWL